MFRQTSRDIYTGKSHCGEKVLFSRQNFDPNVRKEKEQRWPVELGFEEKVFQTELSRVF